MKNNVKKLKFLKFLANTDFKADLYGENITEDGEMETAKIVKGKCIYNEKVRRIITEDGKMIILNGYILIEGDIAPSLNYISNGVCLVKDKVLNIYAGYRIYNPDGTVNHTKLELM